MTAFDTSLAMLSYLPCHLCDHQWARHQSDDLVSFSRIRSGSEAIFSSIRWMERACERVRRLSSKEWHLGEQMLRTGTSFQAAVKETSTTHLGNYARQRF